MKLINTKLHGFLDYIVGIVLIAMPWIIGLDTGAASGMVFLVAGIMALVYSIFTRYELGLIKIIPMPAHLLLDIFSGAVLAGSPWIFGFSDAMYLPYLIFGLFEIVAAIVTDTHQVGRE